MNLILEINNLDSCNFSQKKLELTVAETIKKAELTRILKRDVLVSIGFVSESEIKKINKKYRNKNSPTDVLSFGDFNSKEELLEQGKENIFLGELLVCPKDIEKYCQEKRIFFEKEFFKVISHGILHLLGFNHGGKMFKIQEEVANNVLKK